MSQNEIREIMQSEVLRLINMALRAAPADRHLFMHQGFGMVQLYLELYPGDAGEIIEWWDERRGEFFA